MAKPILCLDFDGVLHSYESGWQGVDVISDAPTEGALTFLRDAIEVFDVHIYSSRSSDESGLRAMRHWLYDYLLSRFEIAKADAIFDVIEWPLAKPAAFVTIDDRAIQFTGRWPAINKLLKFKPWNKK